TIVVTLKNAGGAPLSGQTVSLAAGSGSSTISAASGPTDANGQTTFTVKNVVVQSVTYTATVISENGLVIPATATVTFTVPATQLVFTSSPVTTAAGLASGAITVQRLDASGNPVTTDPPRTLTLASTSTGSVTFTPATAIIAQGSSSATFTYTDT